MFIISTNIITAQKQTLFSHFRESRVTGDDDKERDLLTRGDGDECGGRFRDHHPPRNLEIHRLPQPATPRNRAHESAPSEASLSLESCPPRPSLSLSLSLPFVFLLSDLCLLPGPPILVSVKLQTRILFDG